ncbi:MAG: hypothetical protein KTR24_01610, partial [Saprospiraceae bacterium]|nr:hypothetical protein [Saprospiraceae bacterium]
MSIEEINRKHYFNTDMYYRVGYGLSSKLLAFRNGIIYLQVVLGRKWSKDYHETTLELAQCWKADHPELDHAIGDLKNAFLQAGYVVVRIKLEVELNEGAAGISLFPDYKGGYYEWHGQVREQDIKKISRCSSPK